MIAKCSEQIDDESLTFFSTIPWKSLQKVNYAALNEGSDDDDSDDDFGKARKPFSSDEDDELMENTGIKEASMHQAQLDESADLFDSLKEESPVAKPKQRKLGAKPEVVKDPSVKASAKRSKKAISDDDDSPIKVNYIQSTLEFEKQCDFSNKI